MNEKQLSKNPIGLKMQELNATCVIILSVATKKSYSQNDSRNGYAYACPNKLLCVQIYSVGQLTFRKKWLRTLIFH